MTDSVNFEADPRKWAFEMQSYLIDCEVNYRAIDSDEGRRRYATLTLSGLLERLEKVPPLKGLLSVHACRDVVFFLEDLHRGRDHAWRSLGPFGGLQQYTMTEQFVRTRALTGVEIIIDALGPRRGAKKFAFEHVSVLAKQAGHDLSAARIKGLYYELQAGRFPHPEFVTHFVSTWWLGQGDPEKIARCDHGHPIHACAQSGGGRCEHILVLADRWLPGLFNEP